MCAPSILSRNATGPGDTFCDRASRLSAPDSSDHRLAGDAGLGLPGIWDADIPSGVALLVVPFGNNNGGARGAAGDGSAGGGCGGELPNGSNYDVHHSAQRNHIPPVQLPVPPDSTNPTRRSATAVRTFDPNDKIALVGFGERGFVQSTNVLPY